MILREHEHEREHERFTSQGKRELSDTTTNAVNDQLSLVKAEASGEM